MLYLTRKVYAVSPSFLNIFILCPASSHQPAVCYSCVSGHLGDFSTSQWVTDCNPHFLPWEMQSLYWFRRTTITKHLGGFKNRNLFSQFWRLEVQSQSMCEAVLSLKASYREGSFLASSQLPLVASNSQWNVKAYKTHHSNLCHHLHTQLSPSVSLCSNFPLLLLRTPVIGLRAHPNPV